MAIVEITAMPFKTVNYLGMPENDRNNLRVIAAEWWSDVHVTRINVLPEAAKTGWALGNHWHDGDEQFKGIGAGKLYVLDLDVDAPHEVHDLPKAGWEVMIGAGVVHAFVLTGTEPVTRDGAIAVLVSTKGWEISEENTHPFVLVPQP